LAGYITSGAVGQTWLTVSPAELWHRLAGSITSGAVAQTWLVISPVELL